VERTTQLNNAAQINSPRVFIATPSVGRLSGRTDFIGATAPRQLIGIQSRSPLVRGGISHRGFTTLSVDDDPTTNTSWSAQSYQQRATTMPESIDSLLWLTSRWGAETFAPGGHELESGLPRAIAVRLRDALCGSGWCEPVDER
jgi:hypothetical protein